MTEPTAKNLLLHDPLSDVTRKERRMLLGISMLGVALVKTGLIPTKISALGVEFDQSNQSALLGILALITVYFLVAFVIYAAADFLAWRRALHNYIVGRISERSREREQRASRHEPDEEREYIMQRAQSARIIFALSGPVSIVRALFEFLLPVIVGGYAVTVLL